MSCEGDTAALLARSGRRVTTPRLKVASALRHAGGHRSAAEIYEQLLAGDRETVISLATVYRTLETLKSLRVVSEMHERSGAASYQWLDAGEAHHHLLCMRCGRQSDLDGALFDRVRGAIRQETGFEPFIDHLTIRGLCRDCVESGEQAGGVGAR